jgi:SAM-dependent methyltransferase
MPISQDPDARTDALREHPDAVDAQGVHAIDRLGIWLRSRPVRRHVRKQQPTRLLDLGCGYHASLLRSLIGRVPKLTGVELQVEPSLRQMHWLSFMELPIEEALELIEPESFDMVLLLSVLEHLPAPQPVLDGIYRVLSPGGTAIVHVPTWLGKPVLEWLAFKHNLSRDGMNDHRTYYRISELWPMVVRAGFRPEDVRMRYRQLGCTLTATIRR